MALRSHRKADRNSEPNKGAECGYSDHRVNAQHSWSAPFSSFSAVSAHCVADWAHAARTRRPHSWLLLLLPPCSLSRREKAARSARTYPIVARRLMCPSSLPLCGDVALCCAARAGRRAGKGALSRPHVFMFLVFCCLGRPEKEGGAERGCPNTRRGCDRDGAPESRELHSRCDAKEQSRRGANVAADNLRLPQTASKPRNALETQLTDAELTGAITAAYSLCTLAVFPFSACALLHSYCLPLSTGVV
jgi:hypothetical protein